MSFHSVGLALALIGSSVAAQESGPLSDKAQTILRDNCARCHDGDKPKAGLRILDYAQLSNGERRLVVPKNPDDSELLQLVECGSMPPGTARKVAPLERKVLRDWIAAGAAPFSPAFGEGYVLTWIQADVKKQDNLRNIRYLSLNHLLADPETAKNLSVYREALIQTINLLSTKDQLSKLEAIDPEKTVFRIALDQIGWDTRPFQADPKAAINPDTINLYDLILLEYPIPPLPKAGEENNALVEGYMALAKMLRPVPYLRGDWFVSTATQPLLYGDLRRTPGKLPGKLPDSVTFVAQRYARNPLAGLAPLDGLTLPQSDPQNADVKVAFEVQDKAGKPAATFPVKAKMRIFVQNTGKKKIFLQLVTTDVLGKNFVFEGAEIKKLKMDDPLLPGASTFAVFDVEPPTGREQLTLFASDEPLPPGILCKPKDPTTTARVVHPPDKLDPTRVAKKTVTYESVPE